MKIAIITKRGSIYGLRCLNAFRKYFSIDAVVVIDEPLSSKVRLFSSVAKRTGLFNALISSLELLANDRVRKKKFYRDINQPYDNFTKEVLCVRYPNSKKVIKFLNKVSPDLVLLCQSGIVRKDILAIPKIGTLNAHPGILPKYRGMDVMYWPILNGDWDNIGCTVHFVDQGIDTGSILEIYPVDIRKEKVPFFELEERIYTKCIEAMIKTVELICRGAAQPRLQRFEDGKQLYKMSYLAKLKCKTLYNNFIHDRKVK